MERVPSVTESLQIPAGIPCARRDASIVSPLRYPGGKRRLVTYIIEALRLNNLRPKLYVEPFAGGASVALQLLNDGWVEQIGLTERDPLVASFWQVVFFDHKWLVEQIQDIRPSLEVWQRFRRSRPRSARGRALKCLFLNRTSFSGILNKSAGPIGGTLQQSAYSIDCRFPKPTLIRRIEQIARLRDRVAFIEQGDWRVTMQRLAHNQMSKDELFFYLDPPFYEKADRLYRFFFRDKDHRLLRDTLTELDVNYILSYDPADSIINLYRERAMDLAHVDLLYSAAQNPKLVKARELIVSNLEWLPSANRLWRTARERRKEADIGSLEPYGVTLDLRERLPRDILSEVLIPR